jgi:hypothetical protein
MNVVAFERKQDASEWCAIRSVMHEKVGPMLAESEELLVQLAPQLSAFA